jgi:hypothetical protein
MGPISCPETTVRNYHSALRYIPEKRRVQLWCVHGVAWDVRLRRWVNVSRRFDQLQCLHFLWTACCLKSKAIRSSEILGLPLPQQKWQTRKFCYSQRTRPEQWKFGDVASHTNGVLPWKPHKFGSSFTSCLHKPAKHFKSPWGICVLWRYAYVWTTDDTIGSKICVNYSRNTFRIARYLGTY